MAKRMIILSAIVLSFTAGLSVLYGVTKNACVLTMGIVFGTFSYHLFMRLAVGKCVDMRLHNHVDYKKRWFRLHGWEEKFYRFLRVKKWKKYMPTFHPDTFSLEEHSLEEIVEATCQAELVHEIIMLLSFVPLLFAIPFGAFFVFLGTSVGSALIDSVFVILQRFNRPRLIKLLERQKTRQKDSV